MIKNAIVYSVEMPTPHEMWEYITQTGEAQVSAFVAKKPSDHQVSTLGFAKHPITGNGVSEFDGGYCLTILKWEKKIDNSAVAERVKEIVNSFETQQGRIVKRKEKLAIKDQVIGELLPSILPSPKYTFVYFHTASKTLIVDTTNDKTSDEATSLLRKAIGSLKATTLYLDNRVGLTQQVDGCLVHERKMLIPNTVAIGNTLELKGGDTDGDLKFKDIDLFDHTTSDEICAQISEGGMYVKTIALNYVVNAVDFQLTDGFKFKKLVFNGFELTEKDDSTALTDWQTETHYAVNVISTLSIEVVKHFTVVEENEPVTELDSLFDLTVAFVTETRVCNISGIQRKFRIGYNRAVRLVGQMEEKGIVGQARPNGRDVLTDPVEE